MSGFEVEVVDTEALAEPPAPEQLKVYWLLPSAVTTTAWLPDVANVPDHAPPAVQEVALVEDHVSVMLSP